MALVLGNRVFLEPPFLPSTHRRLRRTRATRCIHMTRVIRGLCQRCLNPRRSGRFSAIPSLPNLEGTRTGAGLRAPRRTLGDEYHHPPLRTAPVNDDSALVFESIHLIACTICNLSFVQFDTQY